MTSISQERHTQFEKEVKKNGNSNNHAVAPLVGAWIEMTEFMSLPVAFDIEEVREIKTGMDKDAKTYYDDMVKKGTELLAEMKALATTVELEDDATQIKYRMGISNGTLYFEEITKEASE